MKLINDEIVEGGCSESCLMPGKTRAADGAAPLRSFQFTRVGVALPTRPGRAVDPKFVEISLDDPRNKSVPVTVFTTNERGRVHDSETIERAPDVNCGGIGCPDSKRSTVGDEVCAHRGIRGTIC